MKIGIMTIAYNEQDLIGACVKQFRPFGLDHLVLLSTQPWYGKTDAPDNTNNIASSLGADVVCGSWDNEHTQRNFGLNYFKGYDWVLIVDADELYSPADISQLSASLEQDAEAIVAKNMKVYWKTPEYVVSPNQEDRPIVAIRPDRRFFENRQSFSNIAETEATLHHLSYVRDDVNMLKKINSFSHSVDFDTAKWYNDVWLNWTEESTNLHPVNPSQFAKANKQPIPDWMAELLA